MPTCSICGTERPWLQTHHIKPRSLGGENEPENLTKICANCHEDIHGGPCGGTTVPRLSSTPKANAKRGKSIKRWINEDPEGFQKRQQKIRANKKGGDIERWSNKFDACVECGGTEAKHAANGQCTTCYMRQRQRSGEHYSVRMEYWIKHQTSCLECHKTDSPHDSNGLCSRCYRNKRHHEKYSTYANFSGTEEEKEAEHKKRISEAQKIDGWSKKFESCIECGGTESPHKSRGSCERCYMRRRQREKNGYGGRPVGRPKTKVV